MMEFSIGSLLLLLLGLLFGTTTFALFKRSERKIIIERLNHWLLFSSRRLRTTDSMTPPRSSPPEKDSYKDILPPSIRSRLLRGATKRSDKRRLQSTHIDEAEVRKNLIPLGANYKECGPSTYTPMGVSLAEIEALGDFPRYDGLSGIPLPKPYEGFDINTAIPRPYRPFRWEYHQTMCTSRFPPFLPHTCGSLS